MKLNRGIRWTLFAFVGCVVLLVAAAGLVAVRPSTISWWIEGQLANMTGGDVEIGEVAWLDDLDIELGSVSVRVPGVEGVAGEVIWIERMRVHWSRGANGFQVDDLVVDDAVLRLIEQHAWGLTIGGLAPEPVKGGGGPIPRVRLQSLRVESGWISGGRMVRSGDAIFVGAVEPVPDGSGGAVFVLREEDGAASFGGVINAERDRLEAVAQGVSLSQESQQLVPFRRVRSMARRLGLEGAVDLSVTLAKDEPPSASLWLDDVSLRLDPDALQLNDGDDPFWKVFQDGRATSEGLVPPRLVASSGYVEFVGDTLRINGLVGHLEAGGGWGKSVDVPYRVDLEITELPDVGFDSNLGALEEAFSRAPFTLDIRSSGTVRLEQGSRVIVPSEAARILQLFQVRQCDVDLMEIVFHRGEVGVEVDVAGTMHLLNGLGSYAKFPYPLHGLHADIGLEGGDIVVRRMGARGSGDSTVSITGRVEATHGQDLEVAIRAWDVPLDSILLQAMPPRASATLRDVFSREHVDSPAFDGTTHQHVGLDLVVRQDEHDLVIGGEIQFQHLDMTWNEFPVPLRLGAGRLRWADRLYLEGTDGGPVDMQTAQGGGRGWISGAITIPVGSGPAGGRIDLDIADERVDQALLDALMVVTDGRTAPLLDGGLEGLLDARGSVTIDGPDISHDIEVDVRRGTLAVTPSLEDIVGMSLAGPLGGSRLLDLAGHLRILTSGTEADPLVVRAGDTELQLQGVLDGPKPLNIVAGGLHVGPWLLPRFPDRVRAVIAPSWGQWNPAGMFDVSLTLEGEDRAATRVEVTAADVVLQPSQRVQLRDGSVLIDSGGTSFHALRLDVSSGSKTASVDASGEVRGGGASGHIDVAADPLSLGLPVVGDFVRIVAGGEGEQTWRTLAPEGVVALTAGWEAVDDESVWSLDIHPMSVSANWRGRRLPFRDMGGTRVEVHPGEVRLDRVVGDVAECRLDLTGRVGIEPIEVDVGGSVRGPLDGSLLQAFGGSGWTRILDEIAFDDGGGSRIDAGRVHVVQQPDERWSGTVQGQVQLHDAALSTGLRLEDVRASVDVSITLQDDHPSIALDVRSADATIKKARLKNVSGRITSDPTGEAPDRVAIDELAGRLGDGRLVVDGFAAGEDGAWAIEATLTNARLSRLFPDADGEGEPESTGEVDAAVYLRGHAGDSAGPKGVGSFRVSDGHLRSLPALVAVQQVMHLSSPVVGALSFVDVQFFVRGGTATLEAIHLASGPWGGGGFSLDGEGTLDLATMDVHARLRPRGSWPIIRDIIGLLQDQLYEVSLEGPVGNPEAGVVPLPGLSGGTSGSR